MTLTGKAFLVFLLRFMGVGALFALVPVIMPLSWMTATHRWLGLGEMPTSPIVEYLARSLSAFYFLFGAVCLQIASDLDRYQPLVRLVGLAFLLLGVVFTWIDFETGMPWWWSAFEGPPQIGLGAVILFLTRPAPLRKGTGPGREVHPDSV
jgi:hypothetical protein